MLQRFIDFWHNTTLPRHPKNLNNPEKVGTNECRFSIVIACKEKNKFLMRALSVYDQSGVDLEILILISSRTKSTAFQKFKNLSITVYEFPSDQYLPQKLLQTLDAIKTKFVAICTDDDFVPIGSIYQCIEFLKKHSDYASCQGYHISFDEKDDQVNLREFKYFTPSIESESSLERLTQLITRYQPINWAVYRTDALSPIFQMMRPEDPLILQELKWSAGAVIVGKTKRLNTVYCFRREGILHMMGHPIFACMDNPTKFATQYSEYKEDLIKLLEPVENYNSSHLSHLIDTIHMSYLSRETKVGYWNFFSDLLLRNPNCSVLKQPALNALSGDLQPKAMEYTIAENKKGVTMNISQELIDQCGSDEFRKLKLCKQKLISLCSEYFFNA